MAISDSFSHGKDANARSGGRNLPAGALKAQDIRRQVDEWKDPYLREEERPKRPALCEECGAVYANHRWYQAEDAPMPAKEQAQLPKVVCPADRRMRDKLPGGVLTVSGAFFDSHRQTIEELIHNEEQRARKTNPMERIMDRSDGDGALTIQTTNPKLAQRIGHALEKAYHGDIVYKWSDDNHMARINWNRD